jgi:3-hydroxyisobutyrate dehydrogenase
MGAAIAARLIEGGHEVTVWNRSAEKTRPLAEAGAKVAGTPAELATAVEAVVTILTNREAQTAVYEGAFGLLAGDAGAGCSST